MEEKIISENVLIIRLKWSPTPRAVWRGSGGARALRVVSFDSAHQAQLIGVGGYNLAPRVIYFFHENPP
jgi:hypothetical protein